MISLAVLFSGTVTKGQCQVKTRKVGRGSYRLWACGMLTITLGQQVFWVVLKLTTHLNVKCKKKITISEYSCKRKLYFCFTISEYLCKSKM